MKRASEQSEWREAERCRASERSERCERTNVARDRVALSKRDRLTPPSSYGHAAHSSDQSHDISNVSIIFRPSNLSQETDERLHKKINFYLLYSLFLGSGSERAV